MSPARGRPKAPRAAQGRPSTPPQPASPARPANPAQPSRPPSLAKQAPLPRPTRRAFQGIIVVNFRWPTSSASPQSRRCLARRRLRASSYTRNFCTSIAALSGWVQHGGQPSWRNFLTDHARDLLASPPEAIRERCMTTGGPGYIPTAAQNLTLVDRLHIYLVRMGFLEDATQAATSAAPSAPPALAPAAPAAPPPAPAPAPAQAPAPAPAPVQTATAPTAVPSASAPPPQSAQPAALPAALQPTPAPPPPLPSVLTQQSTQSLSHAQAADLLLPTPPDLSRPAPRQPALVLLPAPQLPQAQPVAAPASASPPLSPSPIPVAAIPPLPSTGPPPQGPSPQAPSSQAVAQVELFTRLRRREHAQADSSPRQAARLATQVEAARSLIPLRTTRQLNSSNSKPLSGSPRSFCRGPTASAASGARRKSGRGHRATTAAVPPAALATPAPPADSRPALLSAVHPQVLDVVANLLAGRRFIIEDRATLFSASSESSVPGEAASWPLVAPSVQAPPVGTMPAPASLPPQTPVPSAQVPAPAAAAQPLTAPQAPQDGGPSLAPPTGSPAPALAPATPAPPLIPPLQAASPAAPPTPVQASPQMPHSPIAQPVVPASPPVQITQPPSVTPPSGVLPQLVAPPSPAVPVRRSSAPGSPAPACQQVRACLPSHLPLAFPPSEPPQPLCRYRRASRRHYHQLSSSCSRSSPEDPLAASLQSSSAHTRRRHSDSDAGPAYRRSRRDSLTPPADSSHQPEGH
ncbi:hypothetical protein Efla_003579 [Eimeria flavescens]